MDMFNDTKEQKQNPAAHGDLTPELRQTVILLNMKGIL